MVSIFVEELVGAVIQLLAFTLIPFIWWLITARKKENFFNWIGLKKPVFNGKVILLIFLSAVVLLAYGYLSGFLIRGYEGVTNAANSFSGLGAKGIPAVLAYGIIRTSLSEEIIFRGFILKRVSSKFGFIAGNTTQAICFGLMHGIPFGLVTKSLFVTVVLTVLPGAIGWFSGWINEKKSEGSIIPSWIIHAMTNVLVGIFALW